MALFKLTRRRIFALLGRQSALPPGAAEILFTDMRVRRA